MSTHNNIVEELYKDEFITKWMGPEGEMEGPLYVLWQLIESYQVDIFQVSIHKITEDFLQFIERAKEQKIELASSFVLMASKLIYYKSKALLPDPGFEEEEENERLPPEIIQQLLEYKKFQLAAETLEELEEISQGIFYRTNEDLTIETEESYNINDLIRVYINFLQKKEKIKVQKPKDIEINLDSITVEEKIEFIRKLLESSGNTYLTLYELFENPYTVSIFELIVSFLAILELARLKEIIIQQKEIFGPIYIFKKSIIVR